MPRGNRNWQFKDVKGFALLWGFSEIPPNKDSHYVFVDPKRNSSIIEVQYHAGKSIHPRTIDSCIRNSGIPKKEWKKYVSMGKQQYMKRLKRKKWGKYSE